MRLPRKRKGKQPIDVVITNVDGNQRVRITMGWDGQKKYNSDLRVEEAEDLATMLMYHAKVIHDSV